MVDESIVAVKRRACQETDEKRKGSGVRGIERARIVSSSVLRLTVHAFRSLTCSKMPCYGALFFPEDLSTEDESVTARLIDGKALALQVRERLATESAAVLVRTGMKPGLATILVGDDPASHLYVKSKQKACDAAGIYIDDHKLPASTTQAELLALIEKENADPKIHGILVQLPLPKHIDSKVVLEAVSPRSEERRVGKECRL